MESNEELIRLMKLAEQIKELDLDAELEKRRTPLEKLIKKVGEDELAKLTRKPKKRAVHWRTKKKMEKVKYHTYRKPKAQKRKAQLLRSGASGWWIYVREGWAKQKTPVELTEEEFTQVLWPLVEGKLPMFMRYDTSLPIRLDNIWVVDVDVPGKPVLFDGKEHALLKAGYTITE